MDILPLGTLKELRRLNERNLPLTASLLEEMVQDDGSGGEESLGWRVYDTKCCRKSPVSVEERIVADQVASKTQWWIIFKWDVEISAENRIKIGDDFFEIVGDTGIRTNQAMAKFLCTEDKDVALFGT